MLLYKEEEELFAERLELAKGRMQELLREPDTEIKGREEIRKYFRSQFSFCELCSQLNQYIRSGSGAGDSLKEMRKLNHRLYEEMLPDR